MNARSLALGTMLFGVAAIIGGCSADPAGPSSFSVEPGDYDRAFDAARDVLRSARFPLDRVDARAGVISAGPKQSSGLATPWYTQRTTFRDDREDLFNHQQRTARITFEPATPVQAGTGETPLGESPATLDLRDYEGPMIARVLVVIEREHRPGWQVQPVAIGTSTFTVDPALGPRGMLPSYWVPVSQDEHLAGRLAAEIGTVLAGPNARPNPEPASVSNPPDEELPDAARPIGPGDS